MSGDDTDAFGAVHGAAATDGDNDITFTGFVELGPGHHLIHLGVW